jgi:hypothetical protein
MLTGRAPPATDIWLGLLFLGGAVLEQINYYYVQLIATTGPTYNGSAPAQGQHCQGPEPADELNRFGLIAGRARCSYCAIARLTLLVDPYAGQTTI